MLKRKLYLSFSPKICNSYLSLLSSYLQTRERERDIVRESESAGEEESQPLLLTFMCESLHSRSRNAAWLLDFVIMTKCSSWQNVLAMFLCQKLLHDCTSFHSNTVSCSTGRAFAGPVGKSIICFFCFGLPKKII